MWPFSKRRDGEERRALTGIDGWPVGDGGWSNYTAGFGYGYTGEVNGQTPTSIRRTFSLVPVFGAIRLLADTISSLTPVLYSSNGPGKLPTPLPTPSLFKNPSVRGTLPEWLHRAVVSMASQGDAIGTIVERDYYGFPTMVEWLDPQTVATQDTVLTGPGSYINPLWWWWGRPLDSRNLVHIPWFTLPYRVRGFSPIGAFALTMGIGLGAQEYAAEWFANGGVPPGTFRNTKQTMTKEETDAITARVVSRLRARKPLVYGADWEYQPVAIKPNEAQFVETMQLTATQIAVIYGVPPEKIGGVTGEKLTYSNVEQNALDYLTFSVRPWLVKLETALSNLFPRGQYVKFNEDEMLRTDARTRAEIDNISLGYQNTGWRSQDEVRADRDLPPLPKPRPEAIPVVPAPRPVVPVNGNGTKPATPTVVAAKG